MDVFIIQLQTTRQKSETNCCCQTIYWGQSNIGIFSQEYTNLHVLVLQVFCFKFMHSWLKPAAI